MKSAVSVVGGGAGDGESSGSNDVVSNNWGMATMVSKLKVVSLEIMV